MDRSNENRLGLTQVGGAKLLGIDERTSRRYALGELPVPVTTRKLIDMMLAAREMSKAKKTKRPLRVK